MGTRREKLHSLVDQSSHQVGSVEHLPPISMHFTLALIRQIRPVAAINMTPMNSPIVPRNTTTRPVGIGPEPVQLKTNENRLKPVPIVLQPRQEEVLVQTKLAILEVDGLQSHQPWSNHKSTINRRNSI